MTLLDQPYRCNHCGKLREKDANRWWLIWITRRIDGRTDFHASTWDERSASDPGMKHICGQACAQKQFELWMLTGSLEPPSSRPLSSTHDSYTGKEDQ